MFLGEAIIGCPDDHILQRLLLGQHPDDDAEALAEHIEACDRCVATVSALRGADTLVEAARAQGGAEARLPREPIQALIERLSAMYPAAAEDASAATGLQPSSEEQDPRNAAGTDLHGILSPPQARDELGRLGPYRVLKVLGAGGMGVVFEAEDPTLKRIVALKTLQPSIAACPAARARFLREARAVAAIEDERIVAIHHVGEDGVPFFAMQFLRGQTLADRLRDVGRATGASILPMAEALHIGCEAARGLASAHARGLIHRDVKPGNIFLVSGGVVSGEEPKTRLTTHHSPLDHSPLDHSPTQPRVKLLDFGLVRGIDDEVTLTQPGVVAGTPAYIAPEQSAAGPTDERSDLFGLGCVLYRMTTGTTPWRRDRPGPGGSVLQPVPPRTINPEVPAELSDLMLQLVAIDPAHRPPSASVVAERLAAILERLVSPGAPRRRKTARLWAGVAAAVVLMLAAAGVILVRTDRGEFVIETTDANVAVMLAQAGGITVHDRKTERTFVLAVGKHALPSGEYEIDVREPAANLEFSTRRFTIRRGDEAKVTISLRPVRLDPFEAWLAEVQALPGQKQVEAVSEKLRALNPGFDGNVGTRMEDDQVVEAHIITDHVTDICPLRAFIRLEMLVCRGSESGKGRLADLTPLKSLKHLYYLACSANRIADLAPLRGLALRELICWANPIQDLRPLHGMPLRVLQLDHTFVTDADLWSLPGMPLEILHIKAPYVTELRALAGLPLRAVECDFRPNRHPLTLRNLKGLQTINGIPVLDFWRAHDARRLGLKAWVKRASGLPATEQVAEVTAKLRELNPGFKERLHEKIEDGAVVWLQVFVNDVTDIAPLRAFTKLKHLRIIGAEPGRGRVYDLDPLRELPLEFLDCMRTEVAELSSLAGMKLRGLRCAHTFVRDLTPVRKLPLSLLDCQSSRVGDLTPLKDMGITHLFLKGCPLTDLSPLGGMSIYLLEGDFEPARDGAVLHSIKTLANINGKPASEFWKEFQPQ